MATNHEVEGVDVGDMSTITENDALVLLTYKQAAQLLGYETHLTIWRWGQAGKIPIVKLSKRAHRIRLSDLKAFLNRGGIRAE